MQNNRREEILKVGAAVAVGLLVLNYFILSPALDHWKEQSVAIGALRTKVARGQQLIARDRAIRDHWAEMLRTQLPEDTSEAGNQVYKAMDRWFRDSGVMLNGLTPNWHQHAEGYDTFDFQVNATSDQASLGHLVHMLEVDPLPARLEDCTIAAKDAKGQQLNLTLKFSFVHMGNAAKK
jgi:hypothetical protein